VLVRKAGVPPLASIGAGAGPCANTVLAMKVVVSNTFAFTTAPFLSPFVPAFCDPETPK